MSVADTAPGGANLHLLGATGDELENRFNADTWHASDLGVAAARGRATVNFTAINPLWLRVATKRWSRQRLALNNAFNTVLTAALAFKRFSTFLASSRPPVEHPHQINRTLIERYLAWIALLPLSESTKSLSKVFLRVFLEENRRYSWVSGIAVDAVIYHDELSTWHGSLPRFIAEFVMAQLESETNLERLTPHYRNLIVVLTETGLRAGDACALRFDPLLTDSSGSPCLRFHAQKMRTEQLVPLSDTALRAVRDQQRLVEQIHSQGSPWLFPARRDPTLPQAYETFRLVFTRWQQLIALHDEAGRPTHVVAHQLRHSLGTRLINQGVPQPVIQRLWAMPAHK